MVYILPRRLGKPDAGRVKGSQLNSPGLATEFSDSGSGAIKPQVCHPHQPAPYCPMRFPRKTGFGARSARFHVPLGHQPDAPPRGRMVAPRGTSSSHEERCLVAPHCESIHPGGPISTRLNCTSRNNSCTRTGPVNRCTCDVQIARLLLSSALGLSRISSDTYGEGADIPGTWPPGCELDSVMAQFPLF
jgi:hypothetical protein